jgi:hypothetical protein
MKRLVGLSVLLISAYTTGALAQTASTGQSIDAGAYIHACQSSVDDLTHKQLASQAMLMSAQEALVAANAKIKTLEDAAKAAPASK